MSTTRRPLAVVVDTDVVSYLFKDDTRVDAYRPHIKGRIAVITAQTQAELELWMRARNWGARRRAELRKHLRGFVLAPFDAALCEEWAEAADGARRAGRPISTADAWVAATALTFGVPLVTNNRNDFVGVSGLTVISEA